MKSFQINPKYDADLIGKAYDKGRQLHDGQLRKSGGTVFHSSYQCGNHPCSPGYGRRHSYRRAFA